LCRRGIAIAARTTITWNKSLIGQCLSRLALPSNQVSLG
jgi:hypothetical protein